MPTEIDPDQKTYDMVITRVFEAPRQLVFDTWTDVKHLARWWGPEGFSNPVCEVEPLPGGAINIEMLGPDGMLYPMRGEFIEILVPEKLVFIAQAIKGDDGNYQLEIKYTVHFRELGNKTELSLQAEILKATYAASSALAGMEIGWRQSLDKLRKYSEELR